MPAARPSGMHVMSTSSSSVARMRGSYKRNVVVGLDCPRVKNHSLLFSQTLSVLAPTSVSPFVLGPHLLPVFPSPYLPADPPLLIQPPSYTTAPHPICPLSFNHLHHHSYSLAMPAHDEKTNATAEEQVQMLDVREEKDSQGDLLPSPVSAPSPRTGAGSNGNKPKISAAMIIPVWIVLSSAVIIYNNYLYNTLEFRFPVFLVTWHLTFAVSTIPSQSTEIGTARRKWQIRCGAISRPVMTATGTDLFSARAAYPAVALRQNLSAALADAR
ncbi:hypothetical protein NUW54_g10314 [Trametes sanguinea]|uniref:Uncharacterized protein n=1 Tax=Trametes sanguinea TaxID=158606 RepID=A0ACC1P0F4_9APHY|nr:hypothetical protein NUW54_g10314 [Trametes sanguinea]